MSPRIGRFRGYSRIYVRDSMNYVHNENLKVSFSLFPIPYSPFPTFKIGLVINLIARRNTDDTTRS
jgi:hypothetical protein